MVTHPTTKQLEDINKDLTLKQKAFLKRYFETGNATKAAMEVYDTDDYNSASVIGWENLRKLKNPIQSYMEKKGISLGKLVDKIEEGLEATKATNAAILVQQDGKVIKAEEQGLIEVPDYRTRHRYVETAAKWLKIQDPDIIIPPTGGDTFNFIGLTHEQLSAITNKSGTAEIREEEFIDVLIKGDIRTTEDEAVSVGVH